VRKYRDHSPHRYSDNIERNVSPFLEKAFKKLCLGGVLLPAFVLASTPFGVKQRYSLRSNQFVFNELDDAKRLLIQNYACVHC
jgi:hypothetical protein